MKRWNLGLSCHSSQGTLKKVTAWLLIMALSVSLPTTVAQSSITAKAAETITTILTDLVQVQIGDDVLPMQLYNKGVYEVKTSLESGEYTAKLLLNGKEVGEDTVSLDADGDVYFRLANGTFTNSTSAANWNITSAAIVGNFNGIEFVNTDDRDDVTLVSGDAAADKRYDIASWNPADTSAELDYVGGGIYARTFYFKELAADVTIADGGYKVAANDSWDIAWSDGVNENIPLTIPAGSKELTVYVDTVNGIVYDSVRTGTYKVPANDNSDDITFELVPYVTTVSLIGTVRGDDSKNWDLSVKGYEFTQVSDSLYLYQQSFAKGSYEYKPVYDYGNWSKCENVSGDNASLEVSSDDKMVYFLFDASENKVYDSVNNNTEMGELLGVKTEAAKQEIIANSNDTYKFVCSPESAESVKLTYAVYDGEKLGQETTVEMTKETDGSFDINNIYFGDAKTQVAYYYTIDGTRTLDTSNENKITVGDAEYSVYEKAAFSGRKVTLPGTLNGNSWDASKESEMFTYKGNGLYELTIKNVGAGNYEYKIAINGTWDENYGADAVRNGANIPLTVTETTDVSFTYNDISHRVVNSIDYIFADIKLSGTGIEETTLEDAMLKGVYSAVLDLKAGTYSDLTFTYNDEQYPISEFTLEEDKSANFYFDPVTELYYSDAVEEEFETDKIKFDSKDSIYKDPYGAVATGDNVTFTIETGTDVDSVHFIVKGKEKRNIEMTKGEATDDVQKWTVTTSFDTLGEYNYFFALYKGTSILIYSDDNAKDYGVGVTTDLLNAVPYDLIVYKSGYETPDWMKNAVIYQIFPDRFYDGDTSNDLAQQSSRGATDYEYVSDWYLLPENPEQETDDKIATYPENAFSGDGEFNNEIYGGDVQGIIDRIDYLKALGVTVIYLNPVCASISNHRYDTSDYKELDPVLGDMGDFDELTKVAEENGMKVVLDGVFNHVSDDSKYFDRYYKYLEAGTTSVGAYPYWAYVYDAMAEDESLSQADAEKKAKEYFASEFGITDFSYTEWFDVYTTSLKNDSGEAEKDTIGLRAGKDVYGYDGWWGYANMPIIKSTNGSEYQTGTWAEEIIGTEETEAKDDGSVTKYWLEHGSDGWRLDVANEVSDETWQHFRNSVKALNKDNVIIGEIWTDAVEYLMGDMYDSVTNYMFRGAVTAFLKKDGTGSASEATTTLERLRERYPKEAFYAMMNLVDSHDTTRILSYLDGVPDDRSDKSVEAAYPSYETTSDIAKSLQYVVAFIQMTYPGAPTIYYGDEIGMVGADDPDDRRAMTWGKGNKELVEWYATMAEIRSQYTALRTGEVAPFVVKDADGKDSDNVLAYVRYDDDAALAVMANNSGDAITTTLDIKELIGDEAKVTDLVSGTEYTVTDGKAEVTIPAYKGSILVSSDNVKEISIDADALKPAYDEAYIVTSEGRELATDISISETSKEITVGDTANLSITVTPSTAVDRRGSWKSSNENVATVDAQGKVTAKKAGTATISVTICNGKKAECLVTVIPKAAPQVPIQPEPAAPDTTTAAPAATTAAPAATTAAPAATTAAPATTTKVKKATISSVKNKKSKKMVVAWKKLSGVSGYQIKYSTSKAFKASKTKTVNVKKASTVKKTIKKLKKGKKYYVKVRAYKTVNGKKVYGKYSAVKKVTIKK